MYMNSKPCKSTVDVTCIVEMLAYLVRSNMGAAHNTFIQSINAIVKHAPNITEDKEKPFLIFALTAVCY